MSDTPRTDRDYVRGFEALMSRTNDEDEWVRADFARLLERELAEARKDAERYRWLRDVAMEADWRRIGDLTPGLTDAAIDAARKL